MPLTTTIEGLERYGVILRYDRDYRESLEACARSRFLCEPAAWAARPLRSERRLRHGRRRLGGARRRRGFAGPGALGRSPPARGRGAHGCEKRGAVPNAWIYSTCTASTSAPM